MISWQRRGNYFILDRSTHARRQEGESYKVNRRRVVMHPDGSAGNWAALSSSIEYGWSKDGEKAQGGSGTMDMCTDEDIDGLLKGPELGFEIPTAEEQERLLHHVSTLLQLSPLNPRESVTEEQRSDHWHATASLSPERDCAMDYIALSDLAEGHMLQESAAAEIITWLYADPILRIAKVTHYSLRVWPGLPPDMQAVHVQDFPRQEVWTDGNWHRQQLEGEEPNSYRSYQVCGREEFLHLLEILPLYISSSE